MIGTRTNCATPCGTPEQSHPIGDRKGKQDKAGEQRRKDVKEGKAGKQKRERQQPGTF
jgi:hypothetical protein